MVTSELQLLNRSRPLQTTVSNKKELFLLGVNKILEIEFSKMSKNSHNMSILSFSRGFTRNVIESVEVVMVDMDILTDGN